jgi:hypothetical protein
MAARVLTVVCAWCRSIVIAPPSAGGITHTICPACLDALFEQTPPEQAPSPGAQDLDELRS